jgi:hypothetical protein
MKRMLISLCLSGAVVSALIALDWPRAQSPRSEDAIVISTAVSPETVAFRSEQNEFHSVVVEMAQEISLAYADPKTWGDLPMPLQPYEQPTATPVFQFAMNSASKLSN